MKFNYKPRCLTSAQITAILDDLEVFAAADGIQRGLFIDTSGNVRRERVSSTSAHLWLGKTRNGKPFNWQTEVNPNAGHVAAFPKGRW